jgi:hypothetical protein
MKPWIQSPVLQKKKIYIYIYIYIYININICNGLLFYHEEESNPMTGSKINRTGGHHAAHIKSDIERQVSYTFSYMQEKKDDLTGDQGQRS